MKKLLMSVFVFVLSSSMAMAAAPKMSWGGYVRALMESGEGTTGEPVTGTPGRGQKFGVSNARVMATTTMKRAFGYLQAELADDVNDNYALRDGYVGYKFGKSTSIQIGRFKVPIGMDHTTVLSDLDFAERSALTTVLTHGRRNGFMLSGDLFRGLSYNLASFSVDDLGRRGTDDASAARLMYDGGNLHLEGAYASEVRGDGDDFTSMAFGFSYQTKKWMFKGEHIAGSSVTTPDPLVGRGVVPGLITDVDTTTMYFHVGYSMGKNMEYMVRHYMTTAEQTSSSTELELSNTYLGVNVMPEEGIKFQFNYILVSGDNRDENTDIPFPSYRGLRTANTFLALAQVMF